MKAITLTVHVGQVATRVDNSVSIRLVSAKELEAHEKVALMELSNLECKVLFQPTVSEGSGIKEIKGEFDTKTPSQRMRNTLYALWKHLTDTNQCEISFENFYLKRMEALIDKVKEELPERPY